MRRICFVGALCAAVSGMGMLVTGGQAAEAWLLLIGSMPLLGLGMALEMIQSD